MAACISLRPARRRNHSLPVYVGIGDPAGVPTPTRARSSPCGRIFAALVTLQEPGTPHRLLVCPAQVVPVEPRIAIILVVVLAERVGRASAAASAVGKRAIAAVAGPVAAASRTANAMKARRRSCSSTSSTTARPATAATTGRVDSTATAATGGSCPTTAASSRLGASVLGAPRASRFTCWPRSTPPSRHLCHPRPRGWALGPPGRRPHCRAAAGEYRRPGRRASGRARLRRAPWFTGHGADVDRRPAGSAHCCGWRCRGRPLPCDDPPGAASDRRRRCCCD